MAIRKTRAPTRPKKGETVELSRLDDLLDVPVPAWERNLRKLVRETRTRQVSFVLPPSRTESLPDAATRNVSWPSMFEAQVKRLPRMDRAEEFRMARRYEFFRARVREALENAGYKAAVADELVLRPAHLLPPPQRKRSAAAVTHLERCIDDLERIRNLYVEGALHLVLGPVRRYVNLGVDEPDLIQEGNASLFQAIEGFDWRREVRFKTYAVYWIQQAILKTLYNASRTVRIPIWVQKAYRKIKRVEQAERDRLGAEPPAAMLAALLDMPAERIEEILAVRRFAVSIDATTGGDDGSLSLAGSLPDDNAIPVHEAVREGDLAVELASAMSELPEREQMILRRRYGLDGGEPETLADIASDLGVTAERVRQLQKVAIERLQKPKPMQALKAFS